MMKKMKKAVPQMVAGGMGLGIASGMVSGSASSGIARVGSAMKPVGTIMAGGMVLGAVGNLKKSVKLPKKKRI